jgi:hypothetical protein
MRARPFLVPALALLVSLAHGTQTSRRLSVAVLDENGVAVRGARVTLQPPSPAQALRCETEISGRCELPQIPSGPCQIHVEKEGYYAANSSVEPSGSSEIEITLNHLKEIKETVDVHESPPMIESSQTESQERLTGIDVINIPYPSTPDYRRVGGRSYTTSICVHGNGMAAMTLQSASISTASATTPTTSALLSPFLYSESKQRIKAANKAKRWYSGHDCSQFPKPAPKV